MSRFSLINVENEEENTVDGSWITDVHGTLDYAIQRAIANNAVNSNRLKIAVVDAVNTTTPQLQNFRFLSPLAIVQPKSE